MDYVLKTGANWLRWLEKILPMLGILPQYLFKDTPETRAVAGITQTNYGRRLDKM